MPLSTLTLLQQRRCCGNGCLNCPFLPRHINGSYNTIEETLLEPVSVLEYHGLEVKIINALEESGFYLINDLKHFTEKTKITRIGKNCSGQIRQALSAFLNKDKPNDLKF